ncbi:Allergen Asp f 4 [Cytospora mali]|uniref:Allergen Asp f 4 n=1 Tax=Cytospora mali TaxID=578113 RepID=A0A194USK0_CYTMA|nr:Allergen Asp f 4 [Valsa mali var. pyri (nom. inval.)]
MARLTSLLLLGAIGVSAHPSAHARFHNKQRQVEDRDIGDVITAIINGVEVSWTQTQDYGAAATSEAAAIVANKPAEAIASVATSATTFSTSFATTLSSTSTSVSSAAAATSTSDSSSSSSSSSGTGVTEFTTFADYCSSSALRKRATTAEIFYTGNTGDDDDYGCNIMPLANSDLASQYNNTVKFISGSSDQYCLVWNKMGKDGGVNGFFLGNTVTGFTVPAGGEHLTDVLTTSYGAIGMTWVEWDAENESNGGASGADASCIVAQDAGLTVNGMAVCLESDSSDCSSISADATTVINAYTKDLAAADGIGLHADGPLKITVDLSY